MRNATVAVLAAVAAVSGCIPSERLGTDGIDAYWALYPDTWPDARPTKLEIAGKPFPTRWLFREQESVIWSTVSMVRAIDKLRNEGGEAFEVSVSPTHAEMLASILSDAREAVEQLRQVADPDRKPTPKKWAAAVASALVASEEVARAATEEEGQGDPRGWGAGPVIHMLTTYLNEQSGGDLLAGMDAGEVTRLRTLMTQVVLRLGFAAAGRQDPPGLLNEITTRMRQADTPAKLKTELAKMLEQKLKEAPPAEPSNRLPGLLSTMFASASTGLKVLEGFVRQWPKMESVEFEFRRDGQQKLVSAIVRVKPGQELRMVTLMPFQPVFAFRGSTRITVRPDAAQTKETVVQFETLDGGQADLKFQGIVYGLVRLLAIPLADASLREVRVSSGSGPQGRLTNVAILMEALGDKTDPARILTVQHVSKTRIERGAFAIDKARVARETLFNYITPDRRYTYMRIKGEAD